MPLWSRGKKQLICLDHGNVLDTFKAQGEGDISPGLHVPEMTQAYLRDQRGNRSVLRLHKLWLTLLNVFFFFFN